MARNLQLVLHYMMRRTYLLLLFLAIVNVTLLLLHGCVGKSNKQCHYFNRATLTPINNADSIPRTADTSGVLAKAFYLQLTLWDSTTYCMRSSTGLINTAWAEHFEQVFYPHIDCVAIVSNKSFDGTHPAGSNLAAYFGIIDTPYQRYLYVGNDHYYLLHLPADTGTHTFTISVYNFATPALNITATAQPVKLLL